MAAKKGDKKKLRTTTFGELPYGTWFMLLGDYLQRGMFDKPERPMRYIRVSDRRYINALALINGKLPSKSRIAQISHPGSSNEMVVICPRGF